MQRMLVSIEYNPYLYFAVNMLKSVNVTFWSHITNTTRVSQVRIYRVIRL